MIDEILSCVDLVWNSSRSTPDPKLTLLLYTRPIDTVLSLSPRGTPFLSSPKVLLHYDLTLELPTYRTSILVHSLFRKTRVSFDPSSGSTPIVPHVHGDGKHRIQVKTISFPPFSLWSPCVRHADLTSV